MVIDRPFKQVGKVSGNPYFKCVVTEGADAVTIMIPEDIAEAWDDVLTLEIAKVKHTQRTVNGELVEEVWYRDEIIGLTTITRDLALTNHQVAKQRMLRDAPLPANVGATA
jgi:hypothetical protein